MRLILAWCVVALVTAVAGCGGDDDDAPNQDDERINQIGGVAEAATYAYAATNGEGLLDYLAANIAEKCTREDVNRALTGEPVPIGLEEIKDVKFDGDRATATVVLTTRDGEEEQTWTFVREGGESWRIKELPPLSEEDCGTP